MLYFFLQYATFALLVLAANTAFNDFPRLSSILAQDHFLPNQMAARGDRLAFSNGIVILAITSALLLWAFRGVTNALIPLYAVGVFICFTLSQGGMVRFWLRTKASGGGGAPRSTVSVPSRRRRRRHPGRHEVQRWRLDRGGRDPVADRDASRHSPALRALLEGDSLRRSQSHPSVAARRRCSVNRISKATAAALVYASTISMTWSPCPWRSMRTPWQTSTRNGRSGTLGSPSWAEFSVSLRPETLVEYVDGRRGSGLGDLVTVVVPEVVPRRWWEHLLHNKTALYIREPFSSGLTWSSRVCRITWASWRRSGSRSRRP
jgi:hypothetical protein